MRQVFTQAFIRTVFSLFVFITAQGLFGQSCQALKDSANQYAASNDYYSALEKFESARDCFESKGAIQEYLSAWAHVLDCLEKTLQADRLHSELDKFESDLQRLSEDIPTASYGSMQLTALQFRAINYNHLGNSASAIDILGNALDSLREVDPGDKTRITWFVGSNFTFISDDNTNCRATTLPQ